MSEQGRKAALSAKLEKWLKSETPRTLISLSEVFAEKSFAILVLLLMATPALPIPTAGITHVFEAIVMLLSLEMIVGREAVWLPARWRNIKLSPVMIEKGLPFFLRRIRWFEKWSRPRNDWLLKSHLANRIYGFSFFILAFTAFISPPFSGLDTLPSLGAVLIALAIILEDSLFLLAGYIVGTLGIVVYIGVGKLLLDFLRNSF